MILVIAANDDAMTWEHTVALHEAIPDAQLAIVPGTSHAPIGEKPALVNRLILDFITLDPVEPRIPIRRAGRGGT